jgi:hypothetical protein
MTRRERPEERNRIKNNINKTTCKGGFVLPNYYLDYFNSASRTALKFA